MTSWKLKSCPRCGGDMFLDEEIDGWYLKCLQCSFRKDVAQDSARKEREPAPAE